MSTLRTSLRSASAAACDDAQMGCSVGFARWRSDLPSGGNRYDDELAGALPSLGLEVRSYDVDGRWPLPGQRDRERLAHLLTAERRWLIGNIVASAVPEAVREATAEGRQVTLLLHYFPADDTTLTAEQRERVSESERQAVHAATAVVVTSRWAAGQVAARYGRDDAVVASPGVTPAPIAPGSAPAGQPPRLLWLGRLSPDKDPLTLVDTLARLTDLGWSALLVGPDGVDARLTRQVHDRIAQAGLAGRVRVTGPLEGRRLETVWSATDLLVHTSRSETFGMVVSEALARGIPSVVAAGTGAVEAQRVGATFPPGDPAALADTLRAWLTDPRRRACWRADAAAMRGQLPTWRDTAAAVATALTE